MIHIVFLRKGDFAMVNQMKNMDPETIHTICEQLRPLHQVKKDTFSKYNVKRGLRNADGTGVMAGITRLGNVHGYLLNEGEREPIEGKLTYRGIDLYDLLYACAVRVSQAALDIVL